MEIAYKKAADEAGLTIAEVGVWRNTLAADPDERKRWIDYAIRQLRMALWVAVIQRQTGQRRDRGLPGAGGCCDSATNGTEKLLGR